MESRQNKETKVNSLPDTDKESLHLIIDRLKDVKDKKPSEISEDSFSFNLVSLSIITCRASLSVSGKLFTLVSLFFLDSMEFYIKFERFISIYS